MTLYKREYLISPKLKDLKRFTEPIRIAVLASGNGSNLEALAKSISKGELGAQIKILIVNNPLCKAIDKAKKFNIKYEIINTKDPNKSFSYEQDIINILKEYDVELIVMAGWMKIVSYKLIKEYKNRIINLHPSILPSFKGVKALEKAYSYGVKIAGCSVHYVTEEVDSGELIIQSAISIDRTDTLEQVKKNIQKLEHMILPIAVGISGAKLRE